MASMDSLEQAVQVHPSPSSEICVPSTPPAADPLEHSSRQLEKAAFLSPPPPSINMDMTPPPSTQVAKHRSPRVHAQSTQIHPFPASPPATVRVNALATLPTTDVVAQAGGEELRSMVQELILAVREARIAAAHFKLQHNLLSIETQESAQRAEVEHQMTRREVEVLQAAEHRRRIAMSTPPRIPQPLSQPEVDALNKKCSDLQVEKGDLERKLRRAKKLIQQEKDKTELAGEENTLLKRRIRENREHFTHIKNPSPSYTTPRNDFATPQRKAAPRFSESARSQGTIAALLAADQVLSGEAASVPSTPTKAQPTRLNQGHNRGAYSLSSLPSTAARSRPVTADGRFYHNIGHFDSQLSYPPPFAQVVSESAERDRHDRHDRDSTISVSDAEEAFTDEDLPQSQASSLATNMLRRNPGSQESSVASAKAEKSSTLLHSKLFGAVKKAGIDRLGKEGKRYASFGEADVPSKKARLGEGVGLGIGAWESPRS